MSIVLASKSPRRQQLLKEIVDDFIIDVADVDENLPPEINYLDAVKDLAKKKALAVFNKRNDDIIIGADTIVYAKNEILGKPKDKDDVKRMIMLLSNDTHVVATGVCVVSKDFIDCFVEITEVTFKKMSEVEIDEYCKLDTVYDKAGAYAIQAEAKKYISKINGDYNNVVGLPVDRLNQCLIKHNIK